MDQSCVENRWQHDFQAPALCSQPDSENTLHGDKMISGLQPCGKDADSCLEANQTYDSRLGWAVHTFRRHLEKAVM